MERGKKELICSTDVKVAGVVAGIAEYLGMNVKAARMLYILFTVATGLALGVILYVVLLFIMVVLNGTNNKLAHNA